MALNESDVDRILATLKSAMMAILDNQSSADNSTDCKFKKMAQQLLFKKVYETSKSMITQEELQCLKTKKGNTQVSERDSIGLIRRSLDTLGLSYDEAGSQQSKDFRNIGKIGLNIEVKKVDSKTVIFNDTCPTKDIWYIILFTGIDTTRTNIPPCVLGMNGSEFITDSEWIQEYKLLLEGVKDVYCRGDEKKKLSGNMSAYVRPTFRADISHFLKFASNP